MTTITTGTSGPKAWKIALVAGAVGLATIVATNLPQTASETPSQPAAETATATLPESVTGFEYNTESTPGRAASPGVTSEYLGNSGELFPYENGSAPPSAVDQATINGLAPVITQEYLDGLGAPTRVDPRAAIAAGLDPGAIDAVVGNTSVAPAPFVDLDQMIRDMIAEVQARQVTPLAASDEALVVPPTAVGSTSRIDPGAAAAAGLNPGVIDAIVGGTAREAVVPDNLADAQDRAEAVTATPTVGLPSNGNAQAGINARWEALHEAYHSGTLSSAYTGDRVTTYDAQPAWQAYRDAVNSGSAGTYYQSSATDASPNTSPADIKFLQESTGTSGSQRIPQQNVSIR